MFNNNEPNNAERASLLFVSHTAEMGGPTHSLLLLLQYVRQWYDISVLLPENGQLTSELSRQRIRFFVIPGLRRNSIPEIFRLIRREGFDLVYGNNPSGRCRNAMLAGKLAGKPFIWHFRSLKKEWAKRNSVFVRFADEVIAVSEACAYPLKRYNRGKEINVVYNGIELSAFNGYRGYPRLEIAKELGLPPVARYVLCASALTRLKGIEQAVFVMGKLSEKTPDVHLLIAGRLDRDPDYTEEIRETIRKLDLEERIHLLGFRNDMPRLLSGAAIFLHTSRLDAHPRAVLEAMASGLPVVAYRVDGVAETVEDGESGFLFPVGAVSEMAETLYTLLEDRAHAEAMGKRGRERVERHFTAETTATQVAQIIDGLLSDNSGPELK